VSEVSVINETRLMNVLYDGSFQIYKHKNGGLLSLLNVAVAAQEPACVKTWPCLYLGCKVRISAEWYLVYPRICGFTPSLGQSTQSARGIYR
jgi:hypothetical protein